MNGDMITPEAAYSHHTEKLDLSSAGVRAVSYGECDGLELPTMTDGKGHPAHASIDFRSHSAGQVKAKAKRLRDYADAREWLHQASDSD